MILKKAQDYLERFPALREKIQAGLKAIGLHYTNHLRILHPLEVLIRDLGTEKIRAAVRQPLAGCEVAPYYGCLLVRPYPLSPGITLESLDALIPALGARLADFDMKTHCCGGSLTGTIEEVGNRLVYILLRRAKHLGANVLVTVCPLCQLNLEVQQRALLREYREDVAVPVPYFTQLIGLALGLPESELGLHRLLVPLETNSLTQGRTAREHVAA
jgi:heterodisulfide reductase subunit B